MDSNFLVRCWKFRGPSLRGMVVKGLVGMFVGLYSLFKKKPKTTTSICLFVLLMIHLHRHKQWLKTVMLVWACKALRTTQYATVRDMLTNTPYDPPTRKQEDHSHPEAASVRSYAIHFATQLAAAVGMDVFVEQQSVSDQRKNLEGTREYYWAKDIQAAPKCDLLTDNHIRVFVDVDYYADMPELLVDNVVPTLLYTIIPESVGEIGANNSSHYFNDDGTITMHVSGGAQYNHKLWNYGTDTLLVVKRKLWCPVGSAAYLVDTRQVTKHRAIVLLTPISKWGIAWAWITTWLYGNELRRLDVVDGKHARMKIMRKDGLYVSTGILGSPLSATIPADVDEEIAVQARIGKDDLNIATIQTHLGGDKQRSRLEAAALVEYHRAGSTGKAPVVYPAEFAVRRYQMNIDSYEPDAKPGMQAFMSPLMHECYAPDITKGNEESAIRGRITNVRSDAEPNHFVRQCAVEFAKLMFPEKGVLVPQGVELVYARQARPTQRALLNAAISMGHNVVRVLKVFLKREAYSGPKDPRIISTVNPSDKLHYSRFLYSLSDYLKSCEWYAFGRTPVEVANKVAALCVSSTKWAVNTDFSRFDGRVSPAIRHFERVVMMRAFHKDYHSEMHDLMRSQFGLCAYSTFGVGYEQGTARASGSAETSAFNSMANAFVAYMALRGTRERGVYLTPQKAYDRLGIYGGDDGLTMDVSPAVYTNAAIRIGQKLECEPVERGSFGVKFLARIYGPEVWFGDTNSCCDLPRQLAKFHCTAVLPSTVTPLQRMVEKSMGFYLMDRHTPIIGPLVSKVVQRMHVDTEKAPDEWARNVRPWASQCDLAAQYPNRPCDWFDTYLHSVLPNFDVGLFNEWLEAVQEPEQLLSPPLCCEPKIAAEAAVVNGAIVGGDNTEKPVAEPKRESSRARPTHVPRGRGRGRN